MEKWSWNVEMTADGPPSLSQARRIIRLALPITERSGLGEQQKKSDDEAEDAETFSERRAYERASELAVGSRRVAQGAREEVAEDVADAESGEAHAEAGQARAEVLES